MCVEFNSPDNFWAIYLRKKHLDLFGLLLFTDMGTGVSRNTEMSKGHHQNVVQNMVQNLVFLIFLKFLFQCNLSDFLLPKHCAAMIAEVVNKKKRDKKKGKKITSN